MITATSTTATAMSTQVVSSLELVFPTAGGGVSVVVVAGEVAVVAGANEVVVAGANEVVVAAGVDVVAGASEVVVGNVVGGTTVVVV